MQHQASRAIPRPKLQRQSSSPACLVVRSLSSNENSTGKLDGKHSHTKDNKRNESLEPVHQKMETYNEEYGDDEDDNGEANPIDAKESLILIGDE